MVISLLSGCPLFFAPFVHHCEDNQQEETTGGHHIQVWNK
jgi:hypothetical protein